jgi:outer membrane protein assembly factor BamD (BamD/ComL family)
MGFDDKAIAIFHEIIEDYPQSGFAYQAQVQLDLLNILYAGK